ncbi:hypothetical protein D3C76_1055920 [compost metagenome]
MPAFTHAARFRVALVPAETTGTLGITLTQFLAGIRLAFVLVAFGVVDQPQLDRIDRQSTGQFIHGALQANQAEGGTGCAHVQRRVDVQWYQFVSQLDVVAVIEHAAPLHHMLGEVLEARGLADGAVRHGQQATVGRRPQLQALEGSRPIAKGKHLLARQADPHGTLEGQCRHHGQRQLILRAQPGTEGTADKRGKHSHLLFLEPEDFLHIGLAVLRALGLVVDVQAAVRLIQHGGGMWLHGVVVLNRRAIGHIHTERGAGVLALKIPTGLG